MRPHHGCTLPEEHADYGHGAKTRIDNETIDNSQTLWAYRDSAVALAELILQVARINGGGDFVLRRTRPN